MERGIIPGQAVFISHGFKLADKAFGKVVRRRFIRGVAVINPAAQRPAIPCGALAAWILPRACLAVVERPLWRGRILHQVLSLEGRDEKGMAVLFEAAATTAQLADRPELRHFRVELRVQSAKLGVSQGIKGCGFYNSGEHVIRYSGVFEMDETISSTV
jgi:hypothetical protein